MASLYTGTTSGRITISASVTSSNWISWNATWGGSATTSIWTSWIDVGTSTAVTTAHVAQPIIHPAPPRRPADRNRAFDHRIADLRAKRLLVENISPAQRESLRLHKYFDVEVQGRTYRIRWGTHGNVRQVVNGKEVRSFCIQPPDVPTGDAMLAQKLLLESDEASFLKIANAREMR